MARAVHTLGLRSQGLHASSRLPPSLCTQLSTVSGLLESKIRLPWGPQRKIPEDLGVERRDPVVGS